MFNLFKKTRLSALLLLLSFFGFVGIGCKTTLPPNSLKTHNSAHWEKTIGALENSARTNPPPQNCILFYGSSSIRIWKTGQDFPGLPVVNRGFGGSQMADLVNYADRMVLPCHPRQIVIYSASNDISAGKAPEIVFGDFVALVTKIRASLPHTRLTLIACAPTPSRWAHIEKIKEFNALSAAYCRKHDIDFVNVFPLMLGPDGRPQADIFQADRLHLNPKGYAIWNAAVKPFLQP